MSKDLAQHNRSYKWLTKHNFQYLGSYKEKDLYLKNGDYSKYIRLQNSDEFKDFDNFNVTDLKNIVNNWKIRFQWHFEINKDTFIEAFIRAERAGLV